MSAVTGSNAEGATAGAARPGREAPVSPQTRRASGLAKVSRRGSLRRGSASRTVLALAVLAARTAFGFSDDGLSVNRSFNRTYTLTNSSIVVTCTLTNSTTNTLRGFLYAEQLPTSLTVASLGVTLNGRSLTNYVLETGQDGDIYAGCTPWRWVLETPTNYVPANPVPPQAVVQISYSLVSTSTATYSLQQYAWVENKSPGTNGAFGSSDSANQQSISYLVTTNQPVLFGRFSNNAYIVSLQGTPGASYALDWSADLAGWSPVVTNLSSFSYTNPSPPGRAFYRGRIAP